MDLASKTHIAGTSCRPWVYSPMANTFKSFEFEARGGQLPRFSLGEFSNGLNILTITKRSIPSYTFQSAVLEIRVVCEYLYWVFLSAYKHGVTGHLRHEVRKSHQHGDNWGKSAGLAGVAFREAKVAFTMHEEGESEESQALARAAVNQLTESADMVPFETNDFLPGLTREMVK